MRPRGQPASPARIIASLSIPWGFSKGDDDLGGYHLVWPRDLVETAGGLLAAGAHEDARRVLHFLRSTQEADGHWPQNMWLDGTAYWDGIQMDETALPILLVDLARREGALPDGELAALWPMVERAAGFLVRNGPVTGRTAGRRTPATSPFTLAAEIAAPAGRRRAGGAERRGGARPPTCARPPTPGTTSSSAGSTSPAPTWRGRTASTATTCRIAPGDTADGVPPTAGDIVPSRTGRTDDTTAPAAQIVSPDALALVRFGLRAADDPRIVDTVKVIDALLEGRHADRALLAPLQRRRLRRARRTARPSTAPASAAPGRC